MQLVRLQLPEHPQRLKESEDGDMIWDPIRKRYLKLTPEEWVRQSLRAHLVNDLHYPEQLLTSEQGLNLNGLKRRTDLRVYKDQKCQMLIECKAPEIKIDQKVFDQICRYNLEVKASWLLISNGITHIVAWVGEEHPLFIEHIPEYKQL